MSWTFGLPDGIYKLTYFNDLIQPRQGQPAFLANMKAFLYELAQDAMSEVGGFNDTSENIQNSLMFLNQMAISERTKEMAILNKYRNDLKKGLPEIPQLTKILNRLDKIKDLNNINDLDQFYTDLTNAINLIRQNSQQYLEQLERVKKQINKDEKRNFGNLTKDDFRFRAYGDIQSVLNSLIGTATRAQKKSEDSFSGKIREIVLQQIQSKNIMNLVSSGADFAAIAAALVIDVESVLQQELYKQGLSDFTELTDDMIEQAVQSYNNRQKEDQTRLQQAINGDIDDLNQILNNAKSVLNIKTIDSIDRLDRRKRAIHNSRNPDTLRRRLLKITNNKTLINDVSKIEFTHRTSTSHGNLFEFIATLFQGNSIKVQGEAATDVITIDFIMTRPDIQNRIRLLGSSIENAYTLFTEKNKNEYNYSEELNSMNQQIRNAEKELDTILKNLDTPIEDLFVYHESLKLYGGMETGASKAFHGRSMTIMSAIESLYNAADLGGFVLPNQDAIELISYNLSSLAAGAQFKGDLEQIFSICAGLLMFDDIQNMALEASKRLDTGSIKNIHMYLLNGYYVPASMILSYTYENLTNAANIIAGDRAATAKISTGGADTAINKWLRGRPSPVENYWAPTAKSALSGTTVQISFLAGFMSFIQGLTNI